jgi:hypothetical protein
LIATRDIRFGALVRELHGNPLFVKPWKDAPPTMVDCIPGLQILEFKGLKEVCIELEWMSFVFSNAVVDLALLH